MNDDEAKKLQLDLEDWIKIQLKKEENNDKR